MSVSCVPDSEAEGRKGDSDMKKCHLYRVRNVIIDGWFYQSGPVCYTFPTWAEAWAFIWRKV